MTKETAAMSHAIEALFTYYLFFKSMRKPEPAAGTKEEEGQVSKTGKCEQGKGSKDAKPAAASKADDDFDPFADDDDAEAKQEMAARAKAAADKKAADKKPAPVGKSMVVIDVKPWDDTTDMSELEANVRKIQMEGLQWGQSKLVAVGYGIKKLQIGCIVIDELVSLEELEEKIVADEEHVQSMDVFSFNKL